MLKLPGINHLNEVRALEKAGFHIARQGKHIVMTDGTRTVTDFVGEVNKRKVFANAIREQISSFN
ncbi:MAG: hypothetical protein AB4372_39755 [Xenococcus sp. (in: cyanobacteria)]